MFPPARSSRGSVDWTISMERAHHLDTRRESSPWMRLAVWKIQISEDHQQKLPRDLQAQGRPPDENTNCRGFCELSILQSLLSPAYPCRLTGWQSVGEKRMERPHWAFCACWLWAKETVRVSLGRSEDCRKRPLQAVHFQNCIVSLMTGNENMEISGRKMPLPKNMPGRTVASCQVEPEGAGADYSFWHKTCYASE